ncbi:cell envelope integrity protein TolA [Thaumasiovibrio sp. DFM-14]|uniref:cell envelope integrity protein TolA n=1 Tax=Thaumasiovibrio sp. DFM-14 TaxID=3384792 RepID=UPI0039A18EE6
MKKKKDSSAPFIISLLAHGVVIGLLIWGADIATHRPVVPQGNSIEAVVIDPAVVRQQAQQLRQQREATKKAEQDRLRRLEEQAKAVERERAAEEQRLRQLQADKLKAEKETREAEKERERVAELQRIAAKEQAKAEQAAKKAQQQAKAAEAERKQQEQAKREAEAARRQAEAERQAQEQAKREAEAARKKAEAERVAQEEARKKAEAAAKRAAEEQKEAERKARAAEEQQRQQEAALADMFQGLEAETERRSGAHSRYVDSEISRYALIYTQMIEQNLRIDSNFIGKQCRLDLSLASSGLVINVVERGGDRNVCRAATAAVTQVSQFPMPEDKDVAAQLRDISLTIQPQ